MDLVKQAVLALLLAFSVPAAACDLDRWQPHIAEASRKYAVPETWIRAVMHAESAGCAWLDGRPTTSSAGAMGLMQLMPATWAELRQRHGFGVDPYDPRDNILAGAAYLRELADRFGLPGAFAAYHAGPGRYVAHVERAVSLPPETRRYAAQVAAAVGAPDAGAPPADPLFAVVVAARAESDADAPSPDPRLFVQLRRAAPPEKTDADR